MITVQKCNCPYKSCEHYWLVGVGTFTYGSGFTKEVAERIARLLNENDSYVADEAYRRKLQADRKPVRCGNPMIGCGSDFADPICTLAAGHDGFCLSTAAEANFHTDIDVEKP
jgi:hypothetical protein